MQMDVSRMAPMLSKALLGSIIPVHGDLMLRIRALMKTMPSVTNGKPRDTVSALPMLLSQCTLSTERHSVEVSGLRNE